MTTIQRLFSVLFGILTIIMAFILMASDDDSTKAIMMLIGAGLTAVGIRNIIYFFTMARFMVGGKLCLYKGMVIMNLGLFTLSVIETLPNTYMILYLVVVHGFTGLVEVLRAFEAREYGNKRWKMKMAHGIVDLGMAALCLILIHNTSIAVTVYCVGLIYSSILRIISAFSKTTIVYIQ